MPLAQGQDPKCDIPGVTAYGTVTDPAISPFHIRTSSINRTRKCSPPDKKQKRSTTLKVIIVGDRRCGFYDFNCEITESMIKRKNGSVCKLLVGDSDSKQIKALPPMLA